MQGASVGAVGSQGPAGRGWVGVVTRQRTFQCGIRWWLRAVSGCAPRGCDDGGGVRRRVGVMVVNVSWVRAGMNGGKGAVFRDDVRSSATSGP